MSSVSSEEKRTDPDDGKAYTLRELVAKFKEAGFDDDEIEEYWKCYCQKVDSNRPLRESVSKLHMSLFGAEGGEMKTRRLRMTNAATKLQRGFRSNMQNLKKGFELPF